ncbi:Rne/Rng family ribonuclease [Luteimicrobium subarcticum]|uniref:Ribonuclease E n=1 Tax=Luteimicrobium subarcticum TaxID=620910 RepID=A0A2M8WQT9_9MICO|nr:Rne/Rng family ribonuclease [Luteimicrobium subarcticum]PJI93277.1 ribonuclease E [Luteimicrobium subarcticum]
MSTDETTQNGPSEQSGGSRQRPRRRATRSVGAPTDVVVVPQADGSAAQPVEITLPARATAPDARPDTTAPLDVLAELGDKAPAPATGRSRRATRRTGTPDVEVRVPERGEAASHVEDAADAATPVADPAPAPAPEVAPQADPPSTAAEAPKKRARRATSRPAGAAKAAPAPEDATEQAEPTSTASTSTEPAPAAPAPVAADEAEQQVPEKKKRAPRRTSGKKTSASTTEESAQPAEAADAPSEAPSAPAGTRSSRAAAPRAAEPRAAEPDAPAQPPRLATTALLFQAAETSTAPRRSRRAQAPAGAPRFADTPFRAAAEQPAPERTATAQAAATTRADVPDAPAAPTSDEARRPEAEPRGRRPRKRATRPAAAASEGTAAAAAQTDEPTEAAAVLEVPTFTLEDLGRDDREAIDEVESIERELLAEGVEDELPEFHDVDFAADDDSAADDSAADDAADDREDNGGAPRRRRRRGGRGRRRPSDAGRGDDAVVTDDQADDDDSAGTDAPEAAHGDEDVTSATDGDDEDGTEGGTDAEGSSSRRRRRRRRGGTTSETGRATRASAPASASDEVTALKGSTRLEAKRQRRREGRDAGRRRQVITEAEFLARRESVQRSMVVRELSGRTQIAVLEDGVLVEHYVSQQAQASMVGNVYLGRVQNVLPSMEAAFVDIGKGRNAVLYAGEVNWDVAGVEGQPRRIEQALKSGDAILVQVTKDPIGHKGARLTSQVTLAGRYLVFVPGGGMTGISRKLPDTERNRLKKILRDIVPEGAGVIVRTAAEGASEDELRADVSRLQSQWEAIDAKSKRTSSAPSLLQGEPDLAIRVVRDIFNDDFGSLVVSGEGAWGEISSYLTELAPDLASRASKWAGVGDVFAEHRIDEQLAKGMDRKVWLPSGGSLVIDRTEAMTVVDVNTGKFTGSGGTLEETVTRNNLEAAEEIVRQLRLRDIGGIIVIDFIDMVLESNRDLVLRRLVECLGRDRTKHQVAEVTSLGLVQMTRKRVGQGLVEAFSETCSACNGRGFIVHHDPIERGGNHQHAPAEQGDEAGEARRSSRRRRGKAAEPVSGSPSGAAQGVPVLPESRDAVRATLATIAAAAAHAHEHDHEGHEPAHDASAQDAVVDRVAEGRETLDLSSIELPTRAELDAQAGATPEPEDGQDVPGDAVENES